MRKHFRECMVMTPHSNGVRDNEDRDGRSREGAAGDRDGQIPQTMEMQIEVFVGRAISEGGEVEAIHCILHDQFSCHNDDDDDDDDDGVIIMKGDDDGDHYG